MKVKVENIGIQEISGVKVIRYLEQEPYCEGYFAWYPSREAMRFQGGAIDIGELFSWHHALEATKIEYHDDVEVFCFEAGVAVMLFCDVLDDGKPDMGSVRVARIPAGTQIAISPRKGHAVPIAEGDEKMHAVVLSSGVHTENEPLPEKAEYIL